MEAERLPSAGDAIVDVATLEDYCLDWDHRLGAAKAEVFAATLGFLKEHAGQLAAQIRDSVRTRRAQLVAREESRSLYYVDCTIDSNNGAFTVRTVWVSYSGFGPPVMLTCFVARPQLYVRPDGLGMLPCMATLEADAGHARMTPYRCVATQRDFPDHDLRRGDVGCVVAVLREDIYEVEFGDLLGQTHALPALRAHDMNALIDQTVLARAKPTWRLRSVRRP